MNIKSNHYNFKIKDMEIDVNDILRALQNKIKENKVEISYMEFNYLSNAIEYILRSYFKGNRDNDLLKAIDNLYFIINEKMVKKN